MQRIRSFLAGILVVFVILMLSCEDSERLVGKYQAEAIESGESSLLFLELMPNGQGSWSTEEDNVSFKWEIRENAIRLHTKSGGVIIGKIVGETIEINLPGVSEYCFKKLKR